jgi:hypothetical protein
MSTIKSSVPNLPDMNLVRVLKANDGALPTEKRHAIACSDYEEIVVNVVLKNSATAATVTIYAWSDEAEAFISYSTALTYTGGQARVRFRVDRAHIYPRVTAIGGGVATNDRVFLEIGGVPVYDRVG